MQHSSIILVVVVLAAAGTRKREGRGHQVVIIPAMYDPPPQCVMGMAPLQDITAPAA